MTFDLEGLTANFIFSSNERRTVAASPQVLRAELRLQELEELVSPCRVLQRLLQGEAPLLHTLLAGIPTAQTGEEENISTLGREAETSQHLRSSARGSWRYLASKSQKEVSSLIQGLDGSVAETNGSYSINCSV